MTIRSINILIHLIEGINLLCGQYQTYHLQSCMNKLCQIAHFRRVINVCMTRSALHEYLRSTYSLIVGHKYTSPILRVYKCMTYYLVPYGIKLITDCMKLLYGFQNIFQQVVYGIRYVTKKVVHL